MDEAKKRKKLNGRTVLIAGAIVFSVLAAGCAAAEAASRGPDVSGEAQSAGVSAIGSQESLEPGTHVIRVWHEGKKRSYRIYVPEELQDPAPLIVVLHGGGGNGVGFQDQNGMDAIADREGFAVVYANGTGELQNAFLTWNSGFNCCGYALKNDVDDVGYLRKVIESAQARLPIDASRVSMTGHSNGAMMAYRFAAEAPEMVSAIVPVGGALSVADPQPSVAVPLLHIHSLDDPRAHYGGGQSPPFPIGGSTHIAEPVLPGIETWADLNGCAGASEIIDGFAGTGENEGQTVKRFAWTCPENADVEHLLLTGSGHGWPGVDIGGWWQKQMGDPTTIIDASEEVWAFVSRFES